MAKVKATLTSANLTIFGKRSIADAMHRKGRSFVGAAVLLQRQRGDPAVVLHLICQGIENLAKSYLLYVDHDKYKPLLRREFGHRLDRLLPKTLNVYGLKKLKPDLEAELKTLSGYYAQHMFRYGGMFDIFIDPNSIKYEATLRRVAASIRLANRELIRKGAR